MKGDDLGKQLQKNPSIHQGLPCTCGSLHFRTRKGGLVSLLPCLIVLMFLTCSSSPEARYESSSFLVDLLGGSWGARTLPSIFNPLQQVSFEL